MSRQALEGLKVLDVGNIVAGPWAATLLADFGADVIKVEPPNGDLIRSMGNINNMWYTVEARNKKNITLNLKTEKGKEILWKLIEDADVLVENFRTGVFERMGFSWDELHKRNPRLVYLSTSGYGRTGPYAMRPGFDRLGAAYGGLSSVTGEPDKAPTKIGISLTDYYTALFGCTAIMFAIYDRDINGSGEGQMIDCALTETTLRLQETILAEYSFNGKVRKRAGNGSTVAIPSGHFLTKDDKYIAAVFAGDKLFAECMNRIGHPEIAEDPRYKSGENKSADREKLNKVFADWARTKTMDEALEILGDDLPAGPIYDVEDIMKDPQFEARGDIIEVDSDSFGKIKMQGIVPKMLTTPGEVKWAGKKLGAFNEEIYKEVLGFSEEEIKQLALEKVI